MEDTGEFPLLLYVTYWYLSCDVIFTDNNFFFLSCFETVVAFILSVSLR